MIKINEKFNELSRFLDKGAEKTEDRKQNGAWGQEAFQLM